MSGQQKTGTDSFDRLFYPGTQTLVNNFNIRDASQLQALERQISSLAAAELKKNPVKGDYDLKHMQDIHRGMFGKLYPWAGELRDHNLFKRRPDGHQSEFARPNEFAGLNRELKALVKSYRESANEREIAERLARIYQVANEMHPFREGNGRTHRIFLDQLAAEKGHRLDYSKVDKAAWNHAAAMSGNVATPDGERYPGRLDELNKVFRHIAGPVEKQNPYTAGKAQGAGENNVGQKQGVLTIAELNPRITEQRNAGLRLK